MSTAALPLSRGAAWLLVGLAVAAYANAFAGTFLFDDHAAILDDPRLRSFGAFGAGAADAIRPFAKATYVVDRWLYGDRPAGYHALNLLLHVASGMLLLRILAHPAVGADRRTAFWTALLFLLHPIATETVTYLSGRPTGLMTCAYLAAFLLCLQAREAGPAGRRPRTALAGAMACLALALAAKETAIVFPVLLVLTDAVLGRRHPAGRAGAPWRVHVALATATVLAFLLYAVFHPRYVFLLQYSLQLRGGYENLLAQANAVSYAITLFARPAQLNFDHDLPVPASILQGPTLLSLATLAALVAAAWRLRRRAPLVSFGILWFFLHLLPTNSVLPRHDLLSERNLYLPSIGLYLAVTSTVIASTRRWRLGTDAADAGRWATARGRAVARAMQAAFVVLLVAFTVDRNALYADPVAFWADAVAKSPHKARPRANLGRAWYVAGEPQRAIEHLRIALALDPLDAVAQQNLLQAWDHLTALEARGRR